MTDRVRTKKRNRLSFTDEGTESRAICSYCKTEYDTIIRTVPYEKDSAHYRYCNNCKSIIPKNMTRIDSITEPLGSLAGKSPSFEIVSSSRSRKRNRGDEDVFQVKDFPLAGKEDKDLRYFANQGFIVAVNDSNIDIQEPEY